MSLDEKHKRKCPTVTTFTPEGGAVPAPSARSAGSNIRIVQWNIERGVEFKQIVERLKQIDADVLCLQELDIGCERSKMRHVPQMLANELRMVGFFYCEFEELDEPAIRKPEHAAGPNAFHGNAIFTRLEIVDCGSAPHSANFDWAIQGLLVNEPRRGERGLQWAKLRLPGSREILHVYNAHFEVFCGVKMRVAQFVDMLEMAKRHRNECENKPAFKAVICGDFNTMAHGIVRFSPKYARDVWRWLMWGETEGEWFARQMIDGTRSPFRPGIDGTSSLPTVFKRSLLSAALGLSQPQCFTCMEMHKNFPLADPFDVYYDITLNNPQYHGLVQGKFDWMLATRRTLRPTKFWRINDDFKASDHRGLVVEYEIDSELPASVPSIRQPWWRGVYRTCVRALGAWILWRIASCAWSLCTSVLR